MTPEQAKALVVSKRSADRRLVSRAILDDPDLLPQETILAALHRETVFHVRQNLSAALRRVSSGSMESVEPPAAEARAIFDEAHLRALRTVTADLLHQLNPLIGDLSFAASAEIANFEKSKTKDRIDQILRQVDSVAKLHQASKIASFEEFDLAALVKSCVPQDLDLSSITIVLAGPERFIVQGDESLISTAVMNGLRNAVEATLPLAKSQSLTITVNWSVTDKDYWISIIDEGIGYSGNVEGAFEIGSSTKGHFGHGLPSARAAMHSLSGTIELLPQPDKGCAFNVSWPIAPTA